MRVSTTSRLRGGRGRDGLAAALSLVLALLLIVLLFVYFRFFVGRVEEAESI